MFVKKGCGGLASELFVNDEINFDFVEDLLGNAQKSYLNGNVGQASFALDGVGEYMLILLEK